MDFLAPYYSTLVYNLAFFMSIGFALSYATSSRIPPLKLQQTLSGKATGLMPFAILITLWWGLRPPTYAFGDTGNYALFYKQAATLAKYPIESDYLFNTIMVWFAKAGCSVRWWFLLIETVYIFCHAKMCEKLFGRQALIAFVAVLSAFQFYSFGVNGIRNGMAVALMLPAIYYMGRRTWMAVIFGLMAIYTHSSAMLIAGALGLTLLVKDTRLYLLGWLLCLGGALVGGTYFETLFLTGGLIDSGHEASYYLNENADMSLFSRTGFRWDFLLYGLVPILWGFYFIVKQGFKDKTFGRLVNIYITCNAFWLLVNQNWLSNRIAYLSWFLYVFILLYPLFRMQYLRHRQTWIAATIAGNAFFTYFMFLIGKLL